MMKSWLGFGDLELIFKVTAGLKLPNLSQKVLAYMQYLTLWDKISQNLAHLEANSNKIIKSNRFFRPSYKTFYEEININHTLLFLSQASYI